MIQQMVDGCSEVLTDGSALVAAIQAQYADHNLKFEIVSLIFNSFPEAALVNNPLMLLLQLYGRPQFDVLVQIVYRIVQLYPQLLSTVDDDGEVFFVFHSII